MPRVGNQHFPYTEAGYAAAARAKKARGYQTGGSVMPYGKSSPISISSGGGINPNNMFTDPNHPLYGRFQGDTAASFRDQLEKIMKNRPTAPRPPRQEGVDRYLPEDPRQRKFPPYIPGQGGDYYPQPLPPRSYGDDMRNIPFIPGGGDATGQNPPRSYGDDMRNIPYIPGGGDATLRNILRKHGQNPPPSKSGGIFGGQYVDDPELNRLYNQLKMTIASGGGVIMQTPEESAASSQAQRQLEQQIIAAGGKPYQYFTRLPHGGFTEGRGPRPGYDPMTGSYPDNINQRPPAIPDLPRPELPDLFGTKPRKMPPVAQPPMYDTTPEYKTEEPFTFNREVTNSCFVAGTPIDMADGSSKNIEDIIVDDEVNTQDGSLDTVTFVHDIPEALRTLVTINDRITCTDSHPFLTEDGWKSCNPEASKPTYEEYDIEIGQLTVGDNLVTVNGPEEVTELISREELAKVYNFTTDKTHTYLVDGVVAHNKSYARPLPDGFVGPTVITKDQYDEQPYYNPETGESFWAPSGGYNTPPGWVQGTKEDYEISELNAKRGMPPGFTASPGPATMALVPFYNPTTGESWTAPSGGYSSAPGWVQGTKEDYEASSGGGTDLDPNAKAFPNAPMGSPRASLTNAGLAYLKRTGQPIPGEASSGGGADPDPDAMAFPDAQPGEPGYGLTNYGLGYMRRKGQQIPGEAPPPQADTPPPTPPQARNYGVDRAGKPLTEAAYNWIISRGGKDLNNDGRINSQELEAYHTAQAAPPPPPPPPVSQNLLGGQMYANQPSATANMTTMQNPYVFGGYGAPPSMPYAGMATPQIPSIMGMSPQAYYGGSAQVGMADPTQRVSQAG